MVALRAAQKALPPGKRRLYISLAVALLILIVLALLAIRRNFA